MEKDAHYFIVGLFVSACLVAAIGFLLWLAGTHDTRHYDRYTVYFTDSVSGLNQGANVQYKGVQVGKVTDIQLAAGRNDLIKVDIEVSEDTPVRSRTTASLATLGVTGLVFIQLTTEPGDHAPPRRVQGEEYPVLDGSGTQLSKLFEDIPAINKQVLDITTKLNDILTGGNMAVMSITLHNIERMTRDMNGLLSDQNVANATTTLQNLSTASNDFGTTMERMNKAADQLEQTVKSLNHMIASNEGNINKFTDDGLRQITATTRETQEMVRSIRAVADKLKQNPSSVIYQPSYKGVETRK